MPNTDPFARIDPAVLEAAKAISLLVLDVDGVLTDGGLYYDAQGNVLKRFDVQDGLGIGMARKAGITVAVITGQDSPAVEQRMRILGIEEYYAGRFNKLSSFADLMERHSLVREQVAYLGDDWVDLAVMSRAGLPLAVANAQPEVKAIARYVTQARGGRGAVREVVRLLLHSRGLLASLAAQWMDGPPA